MRHPLWTLLLAVSLALAAGAQETGGSFGGGDFGGDSGSGSSQDSGSGSDSGYDPGSGSSSGGTGSPSPPVTAGQALLVVAFLTGVLVLSSRSSPARSSGLHLHVLRLGIDWRARRALQEQLARLAATGAGGTAQGRSMLLRETALALVRAQTSWLYASSRVTGAAKPEAEALFRKEGVDARARFQREVVRAVDGAVVQAPAAPLGTPRADEGPGLVVVSLIVAARRALPDPSPRDAAKIREALDAHAGLATDDLVALEVVWSPAVESDRMSSAELEQHYPELVQLDPASVVGRTFCAHCNGPYARELNSCPHCGAPQAA